jgi:hypothetical protein
MSTSRGTLPADVGGELGRPVKAFDSRRRTNADLVADCARLRYLRREWRTLDPTYGLGTWWRRWRPDVLVASDLDLAKSPCGESVDFTALPHPERAFHAVAFDPPYKLNGRPDQAADGRYGVDVIGTTAERLELMEAGLRECARVLAPGGFLLAKCQDQVSGGRVRWQSDALTEVGHAVGLTKMDALHLESYRPQPAGTVQRRVRRNYSTLLVFRRPHGCV